MTKHSLDLSYLKSISMGNQDFELKLLRTFIEQTTLEIEKIREYHYKRNWDSLCASAHKIKVSFHIIGALEMEKLLNTIEDTIRNKKYFGKLPELISIFLQRCRKTIKDVKIEIEKYNK